MKGYNNLIKDLTRTFTLPQFANTLVMGQHETIGSGKFGIKDIFGMLLDGGTLTDSATIPLHNNRSYSLTTAQGSLTLQVSASDDFMPNFVVEITPTVACQLTINKVVDGVSTPLKYATNGGNTMEAGKIYQVFCCGDCWTLGEFVAGSGPTPSYNYTLLQNFVPGHDIGSPDDVSFYANWITNLLELPVWNSSDDVWEYSGSDPYSDLYTDPYPYNLASTVADSKLIDTRNPVDFTKYGISGGTPYAMATSDSDSYWNGEGYTLTHGFDDQFTFEFWMFARAFDWYSNDPTTLYYSSNGWERLAMLGDRSVKESGSWVDKWNIIIHYNDSYGIALYLNFGTYDGGINLILADNDTPIFNGRLSRWICGWHHYAVSRDANNLYFFIDGNKVGQRSLTDVIEVEASGTTYTNEIQWFMNQILHRLELKPYNLNDYMPNCAYAQIALCDSCKWSADFTPPAEAY